MDHCASKRDDWYDWQAETEFYDTYSSFYEPYKGPLKRIISRQPYSCKNMDAWLKTYEDCISSGQWAQLSKVAILDLIFGSEVQFYKGNFAL